MKLIGRPVTFKQHQRHCREEKDAEINHHLYRCLLAVRQAGKPNTASLTHAWVVYTIIYAQSWYNKYSHFLPVGF